MSFFRVLYERVLNDESGGDKMETVWNKYLEFECHVGDLTSMLKVSVTLATSLTLRILTFSNLELTRSCYRSKTGELKSS